MWVIEAFLNFLFVAMVFWFVITEGKEEDNDIK